VRTATYPYTKHLVLASVVSLVGQATGLAFMLWTNPFTTFFFMSFGVGLIVLGMLIFGYVMYREIRARADSLTEKRFPKGEFVFRQGDVGDRVYVVKEGEVEAVRADAEGKLVVVSRVGPGEFFGEMALLTDAPRNASVRAATDVTTLSIGRDDFHALYASLPAFRMSMEAAATRRREADLRPSQP